MVLFIKLLTYIYYIIYFNYIKYIKIVLVFGINLNFHVIMKREHLYKLGGIFMNPISWVEDKYKSFTSTPKAAA